jgi:hypothetical protein
MLVLGANSKSTCQRSWSTGLAANGNSASANAAAAQGGHIRADVHIHGPAHKAVLKTKGAIEAKLHRWPVMSDTA